MTLRRDANSAFAEVTGEKVNKVACYELEISCVCRFYGPKVYIDNIKIFSKDL